jgi:hypothetical protein
MTRYKNVGTSPLHLTDATRGPVVLLPGETSEPLYLLRDQVHFLTQVVLCLVAVPNDDAPAPEMPTAKRKE